MMGENGNKQVWQIANNKGRIKREGSKEKNLKNENEERSRLTGI